MRPAARLDEEPGSGTGLRGGIEAKDVLIAWRDFECSFFAGALLCPKVPFRRFLVRERYRIEARKKLELTPAVMMRRMTKISPYPYWHFFDACAPGRLSAVYRGNGIPLPWGNMTQVSDPCPHWAVFRMIGDTRNESSSQISVLREGDDGSFTAVTRCLRATWQVILMCSRSASISCRRSRRTGAARRTLQRASGRRAFVKAESRGSIAGQPKPYARSPIFSALRGWRAHSGNPPASSVRAARKAGPMQRGPHSPLAGYD
jgi:hypothetical protein